MGSYEKSTYIYKQIDHVAVALDVYKPNGAAEALPVVVYIHGGALIWGSREKVNLWEIEAITAAGMAYVSIDYRLAPETKLMDIKTDIEDALRWVRVEGADLCGLDPDRVAVLGKSAGGYLALLSGTFADRPRAIVSFYGYGDILGDWYACPSPHYLKSPLVSQESADRCVRTDSPTHAGHEARWPYYLRARQTGRWAALVSGYPDAEVRGALASYCPIRAVDARYPPTFLLHGSADTDVPVEQSIAVHERLVQAGIDARLYIVPDGWHGFEGAWEKKPEEFDRVIQFFRQALENSGQ